MNRQVIFRWNDLARGIQHNSILNHPILATLHQPKNHKYYTAPPPSAASFISLPCKCTPLPCLSSVLADALLKSEDETVLNNFSAGVKSSKINSQSKQWCACPSPAGTTSASCSGKGASGQVMLLSTREQIKSKCHCWDTPRSIPARKSLS